ncbi:hypothetical protein [Flavobacterium sp.]|jgi:hypothetical protein|uniref:hypothetical protein n=1 Tax=Flavobacterium sp. TaxID=239 RepID=UPI0035AF5F48
MQNNNSIHTFHIPVMGLAFTIDTPIRVAQFGISSVISITDDELIEKMRALYSKKFGIPYQEITTKAYDYRAERITHYLNLMNTIVNEKIKYFKLELIESKKALENFISILPNKSDLRKNLQEFINIGISKRESLSQFIEKNFVKGEIDVNIMTKVDKENFNGNEQLPIEFNDAHASLRGFAKSELNSSVVLSAGMNPRLYGYFEQFTDFFPDKDGILKKKIVLKVSDFRSAIIQGNFLAKKGLWVSEYRIESGLNCGGHAFATDGFLLGSILEEFKTKREQLIQTTHEMLIKALEAKNLPIPTEPLELKITAQGGVGTAEEHEFLLQNYCLDSVGWGSPFLLVPEATSLDDETRNLLANANEEDYYLSNISPLGVPFNTVKGISNDFWKQKRINDNKAGSSCPKKFLALNKEYDLHGMCTASKKYQDIKLTELEKLKSELKDEAYIKLKKKIVEKACLCVGLANSSYIENKIEIKGQQQGVVICPGPNLAYFNKTVSLADMVKHIYGSIDVLPTNNRPNVFVKELGLYVEHLKKEIENYSETITSMQQKKWATFKANLIKGIEYYQDLFNDTSYFLNERVTIQKQLKSYKLQVSQIEI